MDYRDYNEQHIKHQESNIEELQNKLEEQKDKTEKLRVKREEQDQLLNRIVEDVYEMFQ